MPDQMLMQFGPTSPVKLLRHKSGSLGLLRPYATNLTIPVKPMVGIFVSGMVASIVP